jgi:hypothetical protein
MRFIYKAVLVLISMAVGASCASTQTPITYSNVGSMSQAWSGALLSGAVATTVPVSSNSALATEEIFVGGSDGNLYQFAASGGSMNYYSAGQGAIVGTPIVIPASGSYAAMVIFATANGYVCGVNAATMASTWTCENLNSGSYTNPVGVFSGSSVSASSLAYAVNSATGGLVYFLNGETGAVSSPVTETSPVVSVAGTPYQGGYGSVVATQTHLAQYDSSGTQEGSNLPISDVPVGPIYASVVGIYMPTQSLCPPAYDYREGWVVVPAGSSVYAAQLTSSGPTGLISLSLGSSIAANSAYHFVSSSSTVVHRSGGLLYSCTTYTDNASVFSPLSSGTVAQSTLAGNFTINAAGSQAVSASAEPLFYMVELVSPFSGITFAASGSSLLALEDPMIAYTTAATATGNVTGSVSDGLQVYFVDDAGNIYAYAP